jgi:hypothetical protein
MQDKLHMQNVPMSLTRDDPYSEKQCLLLPVGLNSLLSITRFASKEMLVGPN